jgi:hypothetical protein
MSTGPNAQALGQMCGELLDREEAHLHATLGRLTRVRQLLAGGSLEALSGAAEEALAAAGELDDLSASRTRFRQAAAAALGLAPAGVTVGRVAERLPAGQAAAVLARRAQIRALAEEVQRLNHTNATVAWWCLDFVQQVFAGLHGRPPGGRYGASGRPQQSAGASTWQGQG